MVVIPSLYRTCTWATSRCRGKQKRIDPQISLVHSLWIMRNLFYYEIQYIFLTFLLLFICVFLVYLLKGLQFLDKSFILILKDGVSVLQLPDIFFLPIAVSFCSFTWFLLPKHNITLDDRLDRYIDRQTSLMTFLSHSLLESSDSLKKWQKHHYVII